MNHDLSDNQKRFICRVLFLALCALPTCVTIYCATHKRTPDQWAQILQAELGVETSIGAVDTPKPDQLVLRELILYDNDREPIFDSLEARVTFGNINQIEFRNPITISLSRLNSLMEEAAERLVKPQMNAKPWKIAFTHVLVLGERDGEYFEGPFYANWFSDRNGGTVTMKCPIDQRYENFVELQVARNEAGGFKVEFKSPKEGFVPCWVARQWFPGLETKLGSNAEFSGFATINSIHAKTNCELTGTFQRIELPYLRDVSPQRLRNATAIRVNRLSLDLEESLWKSGTAELKVAGDFELLPAPHYDGRIASPRGSLFDDVVRIGLLPEDFDATMYR